MGQGPVVLAAATRYGSTDELRFQFAAALVEQSVAAGYDIVFSDASTAEVKLELKKLGAKLVDGSQQGSLGAQYRQAVQAAVELGGDDAVIVMVTAEKYDLVQYIPDVVAPIISREAMLSFPSRKSMDSYPSFQRVTEEQWMRQFLAQQFFGRDYDLGFFVLAFRPGPVSAYLLLCDHPNYGVGWWPLCFVHDNFPGMVATPEVDFHYPELQKKLEEGDPAFPIKRKDQAKMAFEVLMDYRYNGIG